MLNIKKLELVEANLNAETILGEIWAWLPTDQVNEIVDDIIKAFDLDYDIESNEILDHMADGYEDENEFWSDLDKLMEGDNK